MLTHLGETGRMSKPVPKVSTRAKLPLNIIAGYCEPTPVLLIARIKRFNDSESERRRSTERPAVLSRAAKIRR